jgi:hypothetical protein
MSIKATEADLAFTIEALRMRTDSLIRSLEDQIHEIYLEEFAEELSKRPAKPPVKSKTTPAKRQPVRRTKKGA